MWLGYGQDHRWLSRLATVLDRQGRTLDRSWVLRGTLVVPEGDDLDAATRQARALAIELGGALPVRVEFAGHEIDAVAAERLLRFEAVVR